MHEATAQNQMSRQLGRTETGVSSEQRILRLLQASAEQQAAIDRILSGQLSLDAIALRAAEAPKGPLLMMMGDAAKLLGVSRATIWRLAKMKRLERVEILPGTFRVRRADIEAIAAGKAVTR